MLFCSSKCRDLKLNVMNYWVIPAICKSQRIRSKMAVKRIIIIYTLLSVSVDCVLMIVGSRNSSYISRLVRQEHVKEDYSRQSSQAEQKSPSKRTFYEAKQTLMEYENNGGLDPRYTMNSGGHMHQHQEYSNNPADARMTYMEADELPYEDKALLSVRAPTHQIRSTESFLNDSSSEYFHPEEYIRAVKKDRTRRRRSKEMIETELVVSSNDDEPKRKPETMRSISEDSGNKQPKPVTRRSLSHPEREKEVCISKWLATYY